MDEVGEDERAGLGAEDAGLRATTSLVLHFKEKTIRIILTDEAKCEIRNCQVPY